MSEVRFARGKLLAEAVGDPRDAHGDVRALGVVVVAVGVEEGGGGGASSEVPVKDLLVSIRTPPYRSLHIAVRMSQASE